ncbi:MAG: branched-chain amino acid ABC transporter permease [Spirochaetales bacterium]|nr:branched-chain amino acid ABC transporter permease [Spirochaetales bacterium]
MLARYKPLLIVLGIVVLIQLLLSLGGWEFFFTQLIMSAYYSLVVIGLTLLMGYAGQISLGHAGFFAIGGYTSALLTTIDLSGLWDKGTLSLLSSLFITMEQKDPYGNIIYSFSPWVAFVVAILIAVGVAFLIGIPVLRLKGHYLAMATLGFGIIIQTVLLGTTALGAADGISNVPDFTLVPGIQITDRMADRVMNYYIAWFFVLLGLFLIINLLNSRVGRALRSIHGNEEAANSLGINTSRYKLYTFVLSAVLAAAGGVFLTHYLGSIGPSEAGVIKSVRYVAIVAVGGMDNLFGTLLMGNLLNFLSLRGYFGTFDEAVFGIILIGIMLFAPKGILRIKGIKYLSSFIREKLAVFKREKEK